MFKSVMKEIEYIHYAPFLVIDGVSFTDFLPHNSQEKYGLTTKM